MILELLSGNPRWQVELTFGSPTRISLQEVKHLLTTDCERNEEFWEEMGDFEKFRDKVLSADSIAQIFGTFRAKGTIAALGMRKEIPVHEGRRTGLSRALRMDSPGRCVAGER
jgi:hypothetical protein